MIYFLYKSKSWFHVDFRGLSEEVVLTIIEIRNHYIDYDDNHWTIGASFKDGKTNFLLPWEAFLAPEYFFSYKKWGEIPREDSPVTSVGTPMFQDIQPTDAFKKLSLKHLKQLATLFRKRCDDLDSAEPGSEETSVFTPLFECEVARIVWEKKNKAQIEALEERLPAR